MVVTKPEDYRFNLQIIQYNKRRHSINYTDQKDPNSVVGKQRHIQQAEMYAILNYNLEKVSPKSKFEQK